MSSEATQIAPATQTSSYTFLKSLASGLSVWSLFLFSGGVVFAVYYARIGYLPDIELNSALSYLAAASIIGASLIVLLTLLIVVPGLIWTTHLTRPKSLKKIFCDGNDIDYGKFTLNLILWLFLASALMHFGLRSKHWWLPWSFLVLAVLKGVTIWFFEIPYGANKDDIKQFKKKFNLLLAYGFWYAVSIGSVLAATYILFEFLDLSHAVWVKVHFAICTFGVVLANAVVTIFLHQKQSAKAVAASMFFALAIIIVGDHFDHVPDKILANYGFGIQNVRLVVNEDVYRTLKEEGLVTDNPKPGANAISDVAIWCRMGQNYFLEKNHRKFSLRKSDVLSWSVEDKP